MLEAVYEWLRQFAEENLDAEFLADIDGAVSVEAEPGSIVVKRYVDGGEVRRFSFVVAFCEEYGVSSEGNMKAEKYFDELQRWIDEVNRVKFFPVKYGCEVRRVDYLTAGYGISNTQRTARFQMQCAYYYSVPYGTL